MSLEKEYQRQIEIAEWIDRNFKINLPADKRSLIAITCFDLTIEHHAAICILFKAGVYGSMFALLRSVFESYSRGLFIRHCATEKEIDLFQNDSLSIEFRNIIKRIEEQFLKSNSVLSSLQKNSWKILNSFTHTGFQHILRRQKEGSTGALNYPEKELLQALRMTGSFALLSSLEFATLTENKELTQSVLEKARDYATATDLNE